MKRTEAVIVAAAAVFLALVLVTFRGPRVRENLPRPAPEFRLDDLDGKGVALSALRGRVVLINFWATWCPPCVEETPSFIQLHRDFSSRGLEVLGVSVDEDEGVLRGFVERFGIRYPVLRDPTAATARRYGTFKYPESYLVDGAGQIVRRWVGAIDWSRQDVRDDIASMLRPSAGQ